MVIENITLSGTMIIVGQQDKSFGAAIVVGFVNGSDVFIRNITESFTVYNLKTKSELGVDVCFRDSLGVIVCSGDADIGPDN